MTSDNGDASQGRFVRVGQSDSNMIPPGTAYHALVKVGTTRGASDVFEDDFADGSFDAWTTVVGDCVLVADPDPAFFLATPAGASLTLTPVGA